MCVYMFLGCRLCNPHHSSGTRFIGAPKLFMMQLKSEVGRKSHEVVSEYGFRAHEEQDLEGKGIKEGAKSPVSSS